MDDNGALLYYARQGITLGQLEAHGITASQNQLALLRASGLEDPHQAVCERVGRPLSEEEWERGLVDFEFAICP